MQQAAHVAVSERVKCFVEQLEGTKSLMILPKCKYACQAKTKQPSLAAHARQQQTTYDRDLSITWPSHTEDAFAKLNGNHPSRARNIGDFLVPRCQRRGSTGRDLQRPRNSGQYAV